MFSAMWFFAWSFFTIYEEVTYWETPWQLAISMSIFNLLVFVLSLLGVALFNFIANHPDVQFKRPRRKPKEKEEDEKKTKLPI